MSLINEALKKAQSERPTETRLYGSDPHGRHHPDRDQKTRKRRYLWGFIVSVLVIGLFTTTLTTFLVYKIAGEDESTESRTSAVQAPEPVQGGSPAETVEEANQATPEAVVRAQADEVETAVDNPPSEPAVTDQPATAGEVVEAAAPEPEVIQPRGTNPVVWARLQQLEIRGILGGGNKVLVFDVSTGKTRSFVEGDLVDGPLGLRIETLSTTSIEFIDYDGFTYTKSF